MSTDQPLVTLTFIKFIIFFPYKRRYKRRGRREPLLWIGLSVTDTSLFHVSSKDGRTKEESCLC